MTRTRRDAFLPSLGWFACCEIAIADFERNAPEGVEGAIASLLSRDLEAFLGN